MSGCFSLRLQYFARKCQAYHGSLQAAVKSKDSVEIKDEQVYIYIVYCIYIHVYIYIYIYCMKPPNNKAPKCTLFSRVKGHKRSPVLPRLIASIVGGSLLWRAHFESLRAAEAKNATTINHLLSKRLMSSLMSKRRSVLRRSPKCMSKRHKPVKVPFSLALWAWSRATKALGCAS